MSINQQVKELLDTKIRIGKTVVPVAHLRYTGKSKTFIVWTVTGETPELIGDDEYLYNTVDIDIDIYSDKNYIEILNYIKNLFIDDDWYFMEQSAEMYEEDEKLYHVTLSFQKEIMNNG